MPSKIWRFALILVLVVIGVFSVAQAQQATCPNTGGGWEKVDGLNSTSYTYSIPDGKTLVEWCYKASTSVVYGSANVEGPATFTITSNVTNQNGQVQNLSHASFRTIDTPEPPCEETNTCPPPPPECDDDGSTEDPQDDCPPPPECDDDNSTENPEDDCPPPPECDDSGETETEEDDCPPPPVCDSTGQTETTRDDCPPPPTDTPTPECEENCGPPPPPNGCEISPFSREDAGNWVNLTSPDGSVVYYTFPIEDRPVLGYAIVNIPTWVTSNGEPYGFYYSDGRLIGTLTVTSNAHGDLTCTWTLDVPQDPEPPLTVTVCVSCGPREEEWYVVPDAGTEIAGRAIDVYGDGTLFYVEDDTAFEGSASRETPYGTVYYGYVTEAPNGVFVYNPCSVTVTLSQVTVNADGTWTFVVLAEQWRSEWELAAQRYGLGQDFLDLAFVTPVGGTFTVPAPS